MNHSDISLCSDANVCALVRSHTGRLAATCSEKRNLSAVPHTAHKQTIKHTDIETDAHKTDSTSIGTFYVSSLSLYESVFSDYSVRHIGASYL